MHTILTAIVHLRLVSQFSHLLGSPPCIANS